MNLRAAVCLTLIALLPRAAAAENLLDSGYIPGIGVIPHAVTKASAQAPETATPEAASAVASAGQPGTDTSSATPDAQGVATSSGDASASSGQTAAQAAGAQIIPAIPILSVTGPQPVPHDKVYARSEGSGIVIAGTQSWYLEEFDALERPATGTTWTSGEVSKKVSWIYYGDTQLVKTCVETVETQSTVTEYDKAGHVLTAVTTDPDGNVLSSVENTYTDDGKSNSTIEKTGKTVKRTTYIYADDGSLLEKRGYTDGALNIVYRWKDEDHWTETVYSKGRVVLVATYVDGERQRDTNEKKR
jgi:antitoxin component YwqK of YwqJK toxin-antitoxin module